jgi:hypothetical protein
VNKELKKQIKEDEVISGFEHLANWVVANRQSVLIGVSTAGLVLAGAWGFTAWRASQTREAEQAFAAALEIFAAPLRSELPPGAQATTVQVFETAAEKHKKAAAAFDGIERRFGSNPVAVRARYFSALSRIEGDDDAAGVKILEELAARPGGGLESALARLALAEQLKVQGQFDKAAEAFNKLATDATFPLPRDYALLQLGESYEAARKFGDARAAYKRLSDEFPTGGYAVEAKRRAERLENAG